MPGTGCSSPLTPGETLGHGWRWSPPSPGASRGCGSRSGFQSPAAVATPAPPSGAGRRHQRRRCSWSEPWRRTATAAAGAGGSNGRCHEATPGGAFPQLSAARQGRTGATGTCAAPDPLHTERERINPIVPPWLGPCHN